MGSERTCRETLDVRPQSLPRRHDEGVHDLAHASQVVLDRGHTEHGRSVTGGSENSVTFLVLSAVSSNETPVCGTARDGGLVHHHKGRVGTHYCGAT